MKRRIVLILTLTFFSFTSLLAQKKIVKKATSTTTKIVPANPKLQSNKEDVKPTVLEVKKPIECNVKAFPDGCIIVFKNSQKSVETDLTAKLKEEQSLTIKKYFVSQNSNVLKDVTLTEVLNGESPIKPAVAEAVFVGEDQNNSSTVETGKINLNDVRSQITIDRNVKELKTDNGVFTLPTDLKDGKYPLTLLLSWGRDYTRVNFMIDFKNGNCMSISEAKQ